MKEELQDQGQPSLYKLSLISCGKLCAFSVHPNKFRKSQNECS